MFTMKQARKSYASQRAYLPKSKPVMSFRQWARVEFARTPSDEMSSKLARIVLAKGR